jgi:hypothetical protein
MGREKARESYRDRKTKYLADGAVSDEKVDLELRKRRGEVPFLCVSQRPRGPRQAMLLGYGAVRKGHGVGLTVLAAHPKASAEHLAVQRGSELDQVLEVLAHEGEDVG